MKKRFVVFAIAAIIQFLTSDCFAQRQIEFIPGVSVRETYDDNIFLDNRNEQSDYITSASLPLRLNVLSEHTKLSLNYTPSYAWYSEFSENNTWRHAGAVGWDQKLTEYVSLRLSDVYINSEDPVDDFSDIDAQRIRRNKYWVNQGNARFRYVYGPENHIEAGYYRRDRENTDPGFNDSTDQRPFASLTYWFNVKHGIRLDYTYTDVELSIDPDFTGHAPGIRYLHRFRPQTIGYVGTTYTTRDYAEDDEDYDVRNGFVGLDHAFSPEYSIKAELGYFIKVPDISEKSYGPSASVDLTRVFSRGKITIGVSAGWDEDYLSRRGVVGKKTGFEQYYGGALNGSYKVLENLDLFAGASYRWSEDDLDFSEDNFRGNGGLRWDFMRWFSLSVQYQYGDRNSDDPRDTYSYNRVMLTLSATKLEKWEW
jgi:hypothetical protein